MPYKPIDTAIVVSVGPLIDDSDMKTQETAIAYNAAGMDVDLFEETATGVTKTDITLTSGGVNDWTHKGQGVYEIEITAAQNNTAGTLWIVGKCDGVLPFESPRYTVVPENVYNGLVAGSDLLEVDAKAISNSETAANNVEANIANLDAAVTSRSSHTAAEAGTDAAGKVLVTPANKLSVDATGHVKADAQKISDSATAANNVEANIANLNATVSSRSSHTAAEAGTQAGINVLFTPGKKVLANASGHVTVGAMSQTALADFAEDDTGVGQVGVHSRSVCSLARATDAGATIVLGPLSTVADAGNRIAAPVALEMWQDEDRTFTIRVVDADGNGIDCSGMTLRFVVQDDNDPPNGVFDIEDANITVGGDDDSVVSVPVTSSDSGTSRDDLHWLLWDTVSETVLGHGSFLIRPAVSDVT